MYTYPQQAGYSLPTKRLHKAVPSSLDRFKFYFHVCAMHNLINNTNKSLFLKKQLQTQYVLAILINILPCIPNDHN